MMRRDANEDSFLDSPSLAINETAAWYTRAGRSIKPLGYAVAEMRVETKRCKETKRKRRKERERG